MQYQNLASLLKTDTSYHLEILINTGEPPEIMESDLTAAYEWLAQSPESDLTLVFNVAGVMAYHPGPGATHFISGQPHVFYPDENADELFDKALDRSLDTPLDEKIIDQVSAVAIGHIPFNGFRLSNGPKPGDDSVMVCLWPYSHPASLGGPILLADGEPGFNAHDQRFQLLVDLASNVKLVDRTANINDFYLDQYRDKAAANKDNRLNQEAPAGGAYRAGHRPRARRRVIRGLIFSRTIYSKL